MQILTTSGWADYELVDSGEGYRLERFGKYIIAKPDPQAVWKRTLTQDIWKSADAIFQNNHWEKQPEFPDKWVMKYKEILFFAKLTPFKHTGIFPEQHIQWDYLEEKIKKSDRPVKVLNLFGYTGIAGLIAASSGAQVTHVDASRPAISWARENQNLAQLSDKSIRWILDDAIKFVQREVRRGNRYDGIIMDPPIYGHGPTGELWDFPKSFPELVKLCSQVLSDKPSFVIVNAYAISSSALMLENVLRDYLPAGELEIGELALEEKNKKRLLSTGIFARWSAE
ncbi:MAG TPA: class I SAM-dependent methyltransferase [Patescibacteria group bacterium]|nr:class I SAM-dependent methyltransferase [Patescibacteria group bacterium]